MRISQPFDTVDDELSLRLCELLELDPDTITQIALTVEPGVGAVVRWDGIKRVALEDVGRAISGQCGDKKPLLVPGALPEACKLDAGHDGAHIGTTGAQWWNDDATDKADPWDGYKLNGP